LQDASQEATQGSAVRSLVTHHQPAATPQQTAGFNTQGESLRNTSVHRHPKREGTAAGTAPVRWGYDAAAGSQQPAELLCKYKARPTFLQPCYLML